MPARRSRKSIPSIGELNVWLVEVACCVFEERSVSRAAARLSLSQPTVSGHLKALESALGTALFDRVGRRVEPTAAGSYFYTHARPLVSSKRDLLAAMAHYLRGGAGTLRLGASSVPGEHVLPGLIRDFGKLHPNTDVQVQIRGSREVAKRVAAGEADLAWVGASWADPELEFHPMGTDRLVLIVPREWETRVGARIALPELRRLPLVIREEGSGTSSLFERCLGSAGVGLRSLAIAAELGSAAAIHEAVVSGLGAAFVSDVSVRSERLAAGVRAVALDGLVQPMERSFHLVTGRGRAPSPLRADFEAFLEGSWPTRTRRSQRRLALLADSLTA